MNFTKLGLSLRLGIRQKVILVLITVLLTALSVSSWMTLQEEKKGVLVEIDRRGTDISRFVSKSMAFSVVGYDYHTIQLLLDEIVQAKDVGYARVISRKGNTMGEAGDSHRLLNDDKRLVLFEQDILIAGDKVGRLILGLDTSTTIARIESQQQSMIKRQVIVILLIAIGEFLALSFLIIRPVSIMTESLNNSVDESGKIIDEIPIDSKDEFGLLAQRFNLLRGQLNQSNEALQSKIDLADSRLLASNLQLTVQSEKLKSMNKELRLLSVTDSLTGLYNRRYFENLMEKESATVDRHDETYSILLIDIDHFKIINDNYGHPEGDIVLMEISSILSSNIRQSDILCRIGGEEFIVLMKRAGKTDSLILAEKLRSVVRAQTFRFSDENVRISVSIGISTYHKSSVDDVNDPIKSADEALYYCKENGRNQVAHYDSLAVELDNGLQAGTHGAGIYKLNLKSKE